MKPKVLLLTSPDSSKNKFWTCSITSPIGSLMPPCDLASIAAVVRQDGIEPKILDLRLFKEPLKILEKEIDKWRPDAIITNMATATALDDYQMLDVVKDRVQRRIVFNFHAMALPDEMFQRGATHILIGDPEYAASEAVGGCDGSKKGVWTYGMTKSEPGWIEQLDNLPYPALDLIDLTNYHSLIMGKEPFSILLANRGCPYECPYCVIPFLFGHKVRTFSVQRTIGEIKRDIKEFGIRTFFFIDSAINLKPQWTAEFCEEIIRENLKIRWCSNMRVPKVTKELLLLMKKAGCFRLFYGVEDLDLIGQLARMTTAEDTRDAFKLTREIGIESVAFIMLFPGMDQTDKGMINRIMKMIFYLNPDAIQCNLAIPYPGSKLFSEYKKTYKMSEKWSLYDPAGNSLPYITELDLVNIRQAIYLRFFLRKPFYLWKILSHTDTRSIMRFIKHSSPILFGAKK